MPITAETLRHFNYADIFIETGCGSGHGIQAAIDANFYEIYSIELYKVKFTPVKLKFMDSPFISLMLGHSADILKGLIPALGKEHVVFWLDAHYDFAARGKGNNLADVQPILYELDAIASSIYKKHTILIDDRLDFVNKVPQFHGISEDDLKERILKINPEYIFYSVDGAAKDSIFVAEIPEFTI